MVITKTEKKTVQVHKNIGPQEYEFYHFKDVTLLTVSDKSCQLERTYKVGKSLNPITEKPFESKKEIKDLWLSGKVWF